MLLIRNNTKIIFDIHIKKIYLYYANCIHFSFFTKIMKIFIYSLIFTFVFISNVCKSQITLKNNEYNGITVFIRSDINEDNGLSLIEKIKV